MTKEETKQHIADILKGYDGGLICIMRADGKALIAGEGNIESGVAMLELMHQTMEAYAEDLEKQIKRELRSTK
jgi:hypothetical protein|nr:MAG TPA: hypothetical protein [Caudoviricetes sp.]DAT48166.1 MAG TPA: hypothetical protein [Caudoviricetes sp.]